MFIDLDVEHEVRRVTLRCCMPSSARLQMNHLLFAAAPIPPALACMEEHVYKLIRSSTGIPLAESLKAVNIRGFTRDIPRFTPHDTNIFVGVKRRFELALSSESFSKKSRRIIAEVDLLLLDQTEKRGRELSDEVETLTRENETLTRKNETLTQENLALGTSLEESERRRQNADFEHFLEVETTSRDLKRKYEEESESAARNYEDLKTRNSQAHERIKELEHERSMRGKSASTRRSIFHYLRPQTSNFPNFPNAWMQPKLWSLLCGIHCRNQKPC
ncbi:hypothetical protein C8F04DRAFT_505083 [Mycena alexandri]|uniref:Uncharacterized protein n=1 Tax=Mycena alexandri TaxID=1745969 RepID=A0AAD6WME4_9AGAR|nr:hypothetical protein C8F04DRAFT_505083 [Mycena alexandri]